MEEGWAWLAVVAMICIVTGATVILILLAEGWRPGDEDD